MRVRMVSNGILSKREQPPRLPFPLPAPDGKKEFKVDCFAECQLPLIQQKNLKPVVTASVAFPLPFLINSLAVGLCAPAVLSVLVR